jgi:protein disulfide-isomerase A6
MLRLTFVVLLALLATILCHNVVDLTASNFNEKVLNSDGIWMVAFVAPWCGHCQRLHPEYDKASDALGGVVNMGRVNCDDEKQLAQQYGVQGFPTIKVFNAGKENKKKPEDYQSHRQAKAIVDYLMYKFNSLPDPVKKLASAADVDSFTSNTDRMKAILFTSKPTNPALFKSLAIELENSGIDFGYVPNSNEELKSRFGVDKEPTVVVIPQSGESNIKYDGAMKKDALMQYFTKFGVKGDANTAKKEDTTYKARPPKAPKQVKIANVATSSHLKTECDRMCVIGFTQTEEQSRFFDSLAQHHAADSDRVRFVTLANEKAKNIAAKTFGIDKISFDDHTLTVVVLRGAKLKYAIKDINDADADAFFDRALFGEYPLKKLDSLPVLEESGSSEEESSSAKTEHDEL